jgi:hypothetical protein
LIADVKDFVDGLQDLIKSLYPVIHQENCIKPGARQIDDVDTLDLLTDVCEVDHPAISDAASEKSEILSLTTTRKWEVEQWTSKVISDLDPAIAEVESLTLTKLKH